VLWVGVGGLVAAGCVHYQPQPISPSETLERFASRRLDDPGLGEFARREPDVGSWPPPTWGLEALTLAAFYYSPDLDLARARWGVAQAGPLAAGQRPNPTLSVLEGYNVTSVGITPWIPEAVLDIPIETAGKRGIRIRRASQLSEAARLDVLSTAWQVRSRLRNAFVDVFVAHRTEELLERRLALEDDQVRILEAQLAAGEVAPNLVTGARITRDRTRMDLLGAAEDGEQALIRMAGVIGLPIDALDEVPLSFDEIDGAPSPLPSTDARRRALTGRSDILAALAGYEASQAALQLEIARQYPDIDLGAGYQLDQTDGKWTLSLSLPLPILSRNRGAIAEAAAGRAEAAARFNELQARVIAEIDSAEAACRAAAERTAAADAMVLDLQRRVDAADAAYRFGEVQRLELVGADRELVAGQLARLDATARSVRATGDLEDAMQSPLEPAPWVLTPPRSTEEGEGAND